MACSAEGAALCYQAICREALAVVGKNAHPRITLDSIAMAEWMPAFDAGDYRGVARFMLESARLLKAAGADFAICPDNSAHRAWEFVQAETPLPWLHIARVLGEEARRRGFRTVGVLGTRFTMSGPVYREALGPLGIETMVPEGADFEAVDRIIFSELVDGVFTVPGDGAVDFGAVLEELARGSYEGWLVVEAEQDPQKAHPLTYARMGYSALSAAAARAGLRVIAG